MYRVSNGMITVTLSELEGYSCYLNLL